MFIAAPVLSPLASFFPTEVAAPVSATITPATPSSVPFYSQFSDISSPTWKKNSCGIASLAMVIDAFSPHAVVPDTLLAEGIAAHAYLASAGWTYAGLIQVAKEHGMQGQAYDLGTSNSSTALAALTRSLASGPVIASVHYKFQPTNPIPHLVVIDSIRDGVVYYNDPAAKTGNLSITTDVFVSAWKKRFIVIRPAS